MMSTIVLYLFDEFPPFLPRPSRFILFTFPCPGLPKQGHTQSQEFRIDMVDGFVAAEATSTV